MHFNEFGNAYGPIFEYTDQGGRLHEVLLNREELLTPTPDGFAGTLATWQRGGVFEHYADCGLVLTDRVHTINRDDVLVCATVQIGELAPEFIFISGPRHDVVIQAAAHKVVEIKADLVSEAAPWN